MKNKIVAAILVIALFIPTIVSVVNYISMQGGEVTAVNIESLVFTDPNDIEYKFSRDGGKEEAKMLDYFIALMGNAEKIKEIPATINDDMTCNVTAYTTAGNDNSYKFYYTTHKEDCFFMNGNGDTYKIKDSDALEFLNSKYAGFLFENGVAPVLSLAGGGSLVPDKSEWNFIGAEGEYVKAAANVSDDKESVELAGGFAMEFTTEPDLFNVKVTNKEDSVVIFDDAYESISGITITSDMTVAVEVTAKWYEDKTRNYYGEQTYVFDASLSAPAEFYAGTKTIQIGEFVCVTALNVTSTDDIKFACEPNISYSPKFFVNGDYAYALIPFNNSLAAGQYVMTFTYGSTSQNITIDLQKRTNGFGERSTTYPDAVVKNYFTDEVKQKAIDEFTPIAQNGSATKYFQGSFNEVVDTNKGKLSSGYGHKVTITGTELSYVHEGVDYNAPAGTEVTASNAGEVVYAGFTDYTGYIVVIEHGYGLKSWYAHMGSIDANIKVGTVVAKGDKLGVCGETGFAAANGVHIGYTVFDVPVCQYTLWADGINKGVPVYEPEEK